MLSKWSKPPKYLIFLNFYGLIRRKHISHKENNRSSINCQDGDGTRSKWIKTCEYLAFYISSP